MAELADVMIREARREDCQALIDLSREIAHYHKHYDAPQLDVQVLERDIFDTGHANSGFYVAVHNDDVIGYGHFFYTYTLRLGRNMHLQDLYVKEKFRNHRIGDKILQAIAKRAVEENITRIEFVVTDWNPAKKFYTRKGATDKTRVEDFHFYEFNQTAIRNIAMGN
ncbi:hypothetical protein QAD02_019917 [Eretmocerus hayati]|uniref:Uncharacterized protein n=1 Tax=Eretmocerus hayati TaxID=131215 RepID=A0ACC2PL40_9HYME|nr:hypothetical protein QAD02_019917 [Eretmocerus hayati]